MSYRLHNNTRTSITLKKSEFITYLFRVDSQDEVKDIIKDLRKEHYKATHVCTAYRVNAYEQVSDDGEPSGTAGQPMLEVLRSMEVENILACVVRYYGGIQLGAGGLIRAYRSSVVEAINQADLTEVIEITEILCSINYSHLDAKLLAIEKIAEIVDKEFETEVILKLHTNTDITDKLNEITNGQIKIQKISKKHIEKVINKKGV